MPDHTDATRVSIPEAPQPVALTGTARRHLNQLAGATVLNHYLLACVLVLGIVAAGLLLLNFRTAQAVGRWRPLVLRIEGDGKTTAVPYEALEYHPRDAELKHFLARFTHDFYTRIRATLKRDYAASFFFLDNKLAEQYIADNRQSKALEQFLAGQGDEVEVSVKSVAIDDLRQAPYHATIEYEKITLQPATHAELRRQRFTGSVVFYLRDRVTAAMIPVNPLGLTISYLREDQAFE